MERTLDYFITSGIITVIITQIVSIILSFKGNKTLKEIERDKVLLIYQQFRLDKLFEILSDLQQMNRSYDEIATKMEPMQMSQKANSEYREMWVNRYVSLKSHYLIIKPLLCQESTDDIDAIFNKISEKMKSANAFHEFIESYSALFEKTINSIYKEIGVLINKK